MGILTWAISNKSCSRMKHFHANDCLFYRKNWTCRNRTTSTTQNSQFGVVHNHLFASCLSRNQEDPLSKTDYSSPRLWELSHIGSNKIARLSCDWGNLRHQWDQHAFNIAWTFDYQKNFFAFDATQFANRLKKLINQSVKSASTIGSNACKSV